ncbi:MAG: ergothioneine biosynthesis protein EgtB [Acidimicrobiales bacterium]
MVQSVTEAFSSSAERQASLRDSYRSVRSFTEQLAAPLSPEDQTVQSMPDVSPTKWHRGHTSWFFETFLLLPELSDYRVVHPSYAYIFNSYYEAVGNRYPRAERGHVSRPGTSEVAEYRCHVDAAMSELFDGPLAPETLDLVELGVHHEQQHQELLLMDIKHVLSQSPLRPAYAEGPSSPHDDQPRKPRWVEHPGGSAEIGHAGGGFSFDNESPRHTAQLVPHAVADRLVTCGDWLEFIEDGGYRRPELWLSEGWATVQAQQWREPLYWDDDGVFTLYGQRPIDPCEPVAHVSYFEADAFARWSGARLPTEAEWETFASGTRDGRDETAYGHHSLHPDAGSAQELFGTVWQWTSSSYSPYPGFRPAPGAVGEYNGKFMVNQQVLRGSACVTPTGHPRLTYRNFFPASARWAFSGLRLARDL